MVIPISRWRDIRPEFIRKKRLAERQLMLMQQQKQREAEAGRRYYGDNLR